MRLMIACAALALATAAVGANASEIYQWTDAKGVTHYSETPPPAGTSYQTRRITDSGTSTRAVDPAPAQATEQAAEQVAADESPQCATARSNIEVLSSEGPVHQEEADGETRELDADQRASQLELAEAAVRAYCTD